MKMSSNKQSKLRIFVGIKIPEKAILETLKIQAQLEKKRLFQGNWTRQENLHLTLKFLGEISACQLQDVRESLDSIKIPLFEAALGNVGVFCSSKITRIIWIHILGTEVLKLQKEIDTALSDQFLPESRFMSHLTIARVKKVSDNEQLIQEVNKIQIRAQPFEVNEFKLIQSTLSSSGPVYTTLSNYRLNSTG